MLIAQPLHTQWSPMNRLPLVRDDSANLALRQISVCREVCAEIPTPEPKLANAFTPLVKANRLMRQMQNDERRPALNFGVG